MASKPTVTYHTMNKFIEAYKSLCFRPLKPEAFSDDVMKIVTLLDNLSRSVEDNYVKECALSLKRDLLQRATMKRNHAKTVSSIQRHCGFLTVQLHRVLKIEKAEKLSEKERLATFKQKYNAHAY